MDEPVRRRRRVRHPTAEVPAPAAETSGIADLEPRDRPERRPGGEPAERAAPDWAGDVAEPAPSERGLRGLVGGGSSQVSVSAALRARDASRPAPEDIKRAEENLTIVRRYWTPH